MSLWWEVESIFQYLTDEGQSIHPFRGGIEKQSRELMDHGIDLNCLEKKGSTHLTRRMHITSLIKVM